MSVNVKLMQDDSIVFDKDLTANLLTMAREADLEQAIWNPEIIGAFQAGDVLPHLIKGVKELIGDSEKYQQYNPSNGWGTYFTLVVFVQRYIAACLNNPEAQIIIA
jgi:hypothetical protein